MQNQAPGISNPTLSRWHWADNVSESSPFLNGSVNVDKDLTSAVSLIVRLGILPLGFTNSIFAFLLGAPESKSIPLQGHKLRSLAIIGLGYLPLPLRKCPTGTQVIIEFIIYGSLARRSRKFPWLCPCCHKQHALVQIQRPCNPLYNRQNKPLAIWMQPSVITVTGVSGSAQHSFCGNWFSVKVWVGSQTSLSVCSVVTYWSSW